MEFSLASLDLIPQLEYCERVLVISEQLVPLDMLTLPSGQGPLGSTSVVFSHAIVQYNGASEECQQHVGMQQMVQRAMAGPTRLPVSLILKVVPGANQAQITQFGSELSSLQDRMGLGLLISPSVEKASEAFDQQGTVLLLDYPTIESNGQEMIDMRPRRGGGPSAMLPQRARSGCVLLPRSRATNWQYLHIYICLVMPASSLLASSATGSSIGTELCIRGLKHECAHQLLITVVHRCSFMYCSCVLPSFGTIG